MSVRAEFMAAWGSLYETDPELAKAVIVLMEGQRKRIDAGWPLSREQLTAELADLLTARHRGDGPAGSEMA